jgi:hypothetical protein
MRGSKEGREYGGKDTPTPPLFSDSVAGATGAAIVPLHSPFCASGLLYVSCWKQPHLVLSSAVAHRILMVVDFLRYI